MMTNKPGRERLPPGDELKRLTVKIVGDEGIESLKMIEVD